MNGVPGPVWREARNHDGRVYYYNDQGQTQWTKPEALMAPAERALAKQPWKEYTAEGGRKYWYNTESKQSTWEMPQVYKDALAQSEQPQRPPSSSQPSFVAGGTSSLTPYNPQRERERDDFDGPERAGPERQLGYRPDGFRATALPGHDEPDYATFEEAESAFTKLLRRSGVQADWSWEDTMRAVIKDPQYRALKDPKDRRATFEKYTQEVRLQEKDRAKERLAKLRSDFATMLRRHPEIKHYTRWKTARPIIEGEATFRSTSDDEERRQLFEEYIVELKKAHVEKESLTRKAAMDELAEILNSLNLEPYTRWSEAQGILKNNDRFSGDEKFKSLSKSDVLTAFESHIKSLERAFNDARQQQKNQKQRRERQNREHFIGLLRELRANGRIKAGIKWMSIHPLIEDDPRYVAMLGQSGSTPLDLFWDTVEDEETVLRRKKNEAMDVLEDKRFEMTTKTTVEDFASVMQSDRRTSTLSEDDISMIYQRLMEKVLKRSEEDKHHLERHQRRAVDALRSRIKHLEPPLKISDTYEDVVSCISRFDEFHVLETDDLRRSAFDKVMRRLKEKEEDLEADRARRSTRSRDLRNGRSRSRRHGGGRPSRTPEPDAYEADRRKAQADRERQYRKSSAVSDFRDVSPRSPLHASRRDRGDPRDFRGRGADPHETRPPSFSSSHYDRERREREMERERSYVSRADPRDRATDLDYGEIRVGSLGGGTRRRRDSEESGGSAGGVRASKRPRRKERTDTPEPPPKKDPLEGTHSGSEEGEIEED